MAYRKALFSTSGPGKGSMLRLIPATLITLFVLGMFYPFVSGYVHARFGKQEDRSALIGQWVGVVQLQPLDGQHQPPSEEHGSGIMTITFEPAALSYLSKLHAKGEITDLEGHAKGMEAENFMTPFAPLQGRFSVRTKGTQHDDTLTGTLTARFTHDVLTLTAFETPQYYVTGILRRGTDQDYREQLKELNDAPSAPNTGDLNGK
jgi:hypothetical protein